MDISKLNSYYIDQFSNLYCCISEFFGVIPAEASDRKLKKIRKWLIDNIDSYEDCPENILKYISSDVSDADFINFFKTCNDYIEENGSFRTLALTKAMEGLSDDVKTELLDLLDFGYNCFIERTDCEIKILCIHCGYTCKIVLENPLEEDLESTFEYVDFVGGSISKKSDVYELCGVTDSEDEDTYTAPVVFRFTDARVEYVAYNAFNEMWVYSTPWDYIINVARNIDCKSRAPVDLMNEKEKALLPLIAELLALRDFPKETQGYEVERFSNLECYANKLGFTELIPLIEKVQNERVNNSKRDTRASKLIDQLNKSKYEPLWREIYSLIKDSQEGYPIETFKNSDELKIARAEIQKIMEENGYTGTYPDFVKIGGINGVHIAESYGISYFVANEKSVEFHLHCSECYGDNFVTIEFLSGAKILKKSENVEDIFSCSFDEKGRRYIYRTEYDMAEDTVDDLAIKTNIAVKKAELKKLSKSERKLNKDGSLLGFACYIFLFMGGLFGVLMTAGFMLIELFATLLAGEIAEFPSLFMQTPWWLICLSCWVLFGAAMSVVTLIAKRR